jgi:hypothetical protein
MCHLGITYKAAVVSSEGDIYRISALRRSTQVSVKVTAIPVTGRRGLRLIDGGKVVSPTHRPHFSPQKH